MKYKNEYKRYSADISFPRVIFSTTSKILKFGMKIKIIFCTKAINAGIPLFRAVSMYVFTQPRE